MLCLLALGIALCIFSFCVVQERKLTEKAKAQARTALPQAKRIEP